MHANIDSFTQQLWNKAAWKAHLCVSVCLWCCGLCCSERICTCTQCAQHQHHNTLPVTDEGHMHPYWRVELRDHAEGFTLPPCRDCLTAVLLMQGLLWAQGYRSLLCNSALIAQNEKQGLPLSFICFSCTHYSL